MNNTLLNFKTHLCIISGQPIANYLPLIDEELKPENVILLVTPEMQDVAKNFQDILKNKNIKYDIVNIKDNDSFSTIQDTILNIIEKYPDTNIALNATGGTKWLSLAAATVFMMDKKPVFYINENTDEAFFLSEHSHHKLKTKLSLKEHLALYGYTMSEDKEKNKLSESHKKFCENIIININKMKSEISLLNKLATEASDLSTKIPKDISKHFEIILKDGEECGLFSVNDSIITFNSHDDKRFCNGIWLELYAFRLVNDVLKKNEQLTAHCSVSIKHNKTQTKNELDIAFIANNRLHIIECKTKNTDDSSGEFVYKLDSIASNLASSTKRMIISYHSLKQGDSKRAKNEKIKIIDAEKIAGLKNHIEEWIKTR